MITRTSTIITNRKTIRTQVIAASTVIMLLVSGTVVFACLHSLIDELVSDSEESVVFAFE